MSVHHIDHDRSNVFVAFRRLSDFREVWPPEFGFRDLAYELFGELSAVFETAVDPFMGHWLIFHIFEASWIVEYFSSLV